MAVLAFSTLDKSQESAIIKITKDTSTSGRPRLRLWKRKKSRNRHLAEWRFRPLMRIVIVNPRIWKVNVIGIGTPPFTEDSGENRPSLCWRPWGSKEPYIFYQTNRNLSTKPPLDKSGASAIIKITQGPATSGFASGQITESRRTRNRHLPEWRFRHVMRIVTVKPKR